LSYPTAIKAAAHKVLDGEAAKRTAAEALLADADASVVAKGHKDIATLDKAVKGAKADVAKWGDATTSFMGLTKPLIELKNPGIISIPLGFLAVIFGSLLYRDKRAEDMWEEVYARQTTGMLASKATQH
jgi:cation/acetate symporter